MALAREGANIVTVARTESEIDETARMVEAETAASALALRCDASDESQVRSAASRAIERFGPVDILVNNHGIIRGSPVWKTPVEDWDEVLAVNLRGAFLFVRSLVPPMIERRRGVIVGVSSTAGLRGYQAPTAGAYVASKAGADRLRSTACRVGARFQHPGVYDLSRPDNRHRHGAGSATGRAKTQSPIFIAQRNRGGGALHGNEPPDRCQRQGVGHAHPALSVDLTLNPLTLSALLSTGRAQATPRQGNGYEEYRDKRYERQRDRQLGQQRRPAPVGRKAVPEPRNLLNVGSEAP